MLKTLGSLKITGVRVTQLIIIILIIGYLSKIAYQFSISLNEDNKVTDKLNKEYINLFSKKYHERVHSHSTYISKVRNDISTFDFDNKYNIVVFKLKSLEKGSLKEPVVQINTDVQAPTEEIYLDIGQEKFDLRYRAGNPGIISEIFLNIDGKQPSLVIKKDSIYSYYLNFSKFSLKYKNEGVLDIYANIENNKIVKNNLLSANLLFLKKGEFIYIFLMAPKDSQYKLKKDAIYQLITDNDIP